MKILDYLKENLLILDGGMGTLLQSAGLKAGELPAAWNITHPEVVQKMRRAQTWYQQIRLAQIF